LIKKRREVIDARNVYQDMKLKTPVPKSIIHDGLRSYDRLNSVVERLNGSTRDREKVMRGMNTKESAQKIIEVMRIHYNFCREHSTLNETPAEAAGLNIEFKENKIENLIRIATLNKE
jgi:transposase-like protein